jgi:hypothetical protein
VHVFCPQLLLMGLCHQVVFHDSVSVNTICPVSRAVMTVMPGCNLIIVALIIEFLGIAMLLHLTPNQAPRKLRTCKVGILAFCSDSLMAFAVEVVLAPPIVVSMIMVMIVSIINDNCAALCRPRKRPSHPSNAQEEQNDGQVMLLSVAAAPYFPVDCFVRCASDNKFFVQNGDIVPCSWLQVRRSGCNLNFIITILSQFLLSIHNASCQAPVC